MPTTIVAQNGKEITQQTKIAVTGCKPAIAVVRHRVKGKTATIVVSVPSAGKLVATGKGLTRGSGKARKAGTVTVKLRLSKKEQAFLAKRHGRRLKTKITLRFTPTHGAKLKTQRDGARALSHHAHRLSVALVPRRRRSGGTRWALAPSRAGIPVSPGAAAVSPAAASLSPGCRVHHTTGTS